MRPRSQFDLGDVEGPIKSVQDPFDGMAPDHWQPPEDLPGVVMTRTYHGHRLYKGHPYLFWRVFDRLDGKPLPPSLQSNSFTDLRTCQQQVDEAIKLESKTTGEAKKKQ